MVIGEQQTMQLQAHSSVQSCALGSDDSVQLISYYHLFQQKIKKKKTHSIFSPSHFLHYTQVSTANLDMRAKEVLEK